MSKTHGTRFDPPWELTVTETVTLQMTEASRKGSGYVADVRFDNGHHIFNGSVNPKSDISRRRVGKKVNEADPSTPVERVEESLATLALALPDLLTLAPSMEAADRAPTPEEVAALLDRCRDLATAPDILARVDRAFDALGMVGEHKNRTLVYLAATARLLDKPVSVAVTGPSSAGKSYMLEKLLVLLPPSAYVNYTSVSDRYLVYSDDDLRHRIVVLFEAIGLGTDTGAYLMRSLLSEGKLEIGTVEKNDEGQHMARTVTKEGPTALFTSTTEKTTPDDELQTRYLRLVVTDSPEHSRAILAGTATSYTDATPAAFDPAAFHALQEWLTAAGERRAFIPYAASLAERVECTTVRIRRDFGKLLTLIAAHAVLHQHTRQRRASGAVVATIEDYATVRDLMAESFAAAQQDNITADVREAVEAVAALCADKVDGATVTAVEVGRYLNRDRHAIQRRMRAAIEGGYIINNTDPHRRQRALYAIGAALPAARSALPEPADLTEDGEL